MGRNTTSLQRLAFVLCGVMLWEWERPSIWNNLNCDATRYQMLYVDTTECAGIPWRLVLRQVRCLAQTICRAKAGGR